MQHHRDRVESWSSGSSPRQDGDGGAEAREADSRGAGVPVDRLGRSGTLTRIIMGLAQLDLGHLEEAGRQFAAAESYWRVKEPNNQRWLSPLRQGRAKLAAASGQMDAARAQVRELLQDLGEALARARSRTHGAPRDAVAARAPGASLTLSHQRRGNRSPLNTDGDELASNSLTRVIGASGFTDGAHRSIASGAAKEHVAAI